MVGALGGFALSMVNSFKRVVSPALVIAYAVLEGVFVGAFSKVIEAPVRRRSRHRRRARHRGRRCRHARGVQVLQHPGRRQVPHVGDRRDVRLRGAAACSTSVLSFFGNSFGFNGFGTMGLISSVVGLGLGVLMLILDFDFVERGIAAGLPERESWRAAFGLTVTIVWIYIELLRILAILRGD